MSRFLSAIIVIVISVVVLSSCITSKNINYLQKPGFDVPAYKDSISYTDYDLRIGDRLYVKIYSTDETTNTLFNGGTGGGQMMMSSTGSMQDLYTYLVENDGCIQFPMVGRIAVAGKTVREATLEIEKSMQPFFKFSSAEIRVMNRSFSVIGNGNSAYINMPQEKINIFKALALAGDIGIFDDRSRVRVLRETDKGTIIKTFDLRSVDILHSEFYYVEPNDVIYIQPLNEQFFRITNLTGLFSTAVATFSFGVLIYDSVKRISGN
ncbi:MAG: polysaccharide biosynthesis/export family protein [Paludibacter sp.]